VDGVEHFFEDFDLRRAAAGFASASHCLVRAIAVVAALGEAVAATRRENEHG
jgi:hypothetical protein